MTFSFSSERRRIILIIGPSGICRSWIEAPLGLGLGLGLGATLLDLQELDRGTIWSRGVWRLASAART